MKENLLHISKKIVRTNKEIQNELEAIKFTRETIKEFIDNEEPEMSSRKWCTVCLGLSDAQPVFINGHGVDMSYCPNCGRDMSLAEESK